MHWYCIDIQKLYPSWGTQIFISYTSFSLCVMVANDSQFRTFLVQWASRSLLHCSPGTKVLVETLIYNSTPTYQLDPNQTGTIHFVLHQGGAWLHLDLDETWRGVHLLPNLTLFKNLKMHQLVKIGIQFSAQDDFEWPWPLETLRRFFSTFTASRTFY